MEAKEEEEEEEARNEEDKDESIRRRRRFPVKTTLPTDLRMDLSASARTPSPTNMYFM